MSGATTIEAGNPLAVKAWSASLFVETTKKSYWDRRFIGTSQNHCIQRITDLESEKGDMVQFDLSLKLVGEPVYGDNIAAGKEKSLRFASDEIRIDQIFCPVNAGGVMSRKRTKHNLRTVARDRLSDYWARFFDEMFFIYLSGSRGMNEGFNTPVTWPGQAGNPINAPDAGHVIYGGTATSKATIANTDKMSRGLIERAATKAKMMGEVDPTIAKIVPIQIEGESHFVCLMSPFQEHDLRMETGTAGWLEIEKSASGAVGRQSPIFTGRLGMIGSTVLHSHESAIRFADYGSGANLPASRALFLGAQAGVIAYGNAGASNQPSRVSWDEEIEDYGRQLNIGSGVVVGVKKTRFSGKDFGVFSIDTYAKDPNAA
jgi:N4-gp56 family major capsid protein